MTLSHHHLLLLHQLARSENIPRRVAMQEERSAARHNAEWRTGSYETRRLVVLESELGLESGL